MLLFKRCMVVLPVLVFPLLLINILLIYGCNQPREIKANKDKIKGVSVRLLNLYNWENYIGKDTLANFKRETGIQVNETNFSDEEEMISSLQSKPDAFDLVVASGELVEEMIKAKLLSPIDYSKLSNFKYINPKYRNLNPDPKQEYSVPYLMGTTGLVINKKYIQENTNSWQVLYDQKYQGKIAMLNNPFEVLAAACKMLGYSFNHSSLEQLERARDVVLNQRPLVLGYYATDELESLMIEEKLWAAQIYSGEGLKAAENNKDIEYIIPSEGASTWMDFFLIPRHAKNQEDAHLFLNFLLRPEVIASIASEVWYAPPNEEAKQFMAKEVLNSQAVYPSSEVLDRCEFLKNTSQIISIAVPLWTELTVTD